MLERLNGQANLKEKNSYAGNDYYCFSDFVAIRSSNKHSGKFNTFAFSRCITSSYNPFYDRQKGCLAYWNIFSLTGYNFVSAGFLPNLVLVFKVGVFLILKWLDIFTIFIERIYKRELKPCLPPGEWFLWKLYAKQQNEI